jgi:hypothetical protein
VTLSKEFSPASQCKDNFRVLQAAISSFHASSFTDSLSSLVHTLGFELQKIRKSVMNRVWTMANAMDIRRHENLKH